MNQPISRTETGSLQTIDKFSAEWNRGCAPTISVMATIARPASQRAIEEIALSRRPARSMAFCTLVPLLQSGGLMRPPVGLIARRLF